eukprot:gene6356-2981_t
MTRRAQADGGYILYNHLLRVRLEGYVLLHIASQKWHHGSMAPSGGQITRYGCALAKQTSSTSVKGLVQGWWAKQQSPRT